MDMKVYVCDRGIKEDASEALNQEVLHDWSWEETMLDWLNILWNFWKLYCRHGEVTYQTSIKDDFIWTNHINYQSMHLKLPFLIDTKVY